MRNVDKNSTPDVFPAFRLFPAIIPVTRKDPSDVIGAPTGDHVAGQENSLPFREGNARVNFRMRAPAISPEHYRHRQQTAFVEGVDFFIELLEEAVVDSNLIRAGE